MNRKFLTILSFFMLVASIMVNAYDASADTWNKKTVLTATQPLRVPGATLPPGKYVFKLLDSGSSRHIVQVLSEDETQIYATILALPNQRLQPAGDNQFAFWETPKGSPQALRSWFYPGDSFGQEFVYSKSETAQLGARNQAPVISDAQVKGIPSATAETAPAQPVAQPSAAQQAPAEPESEAPRQPNTQPDQETPDTREQEPVGSAEPESAAYQQASGQPAQDTPVATQQPAVAQESTSLPKTASPYPLLGLIGLMASGAAYGFRKFRNRLS